MHCEVTFGGHEEILQTGENKESPKKCSAFIFQTQLKGTHIGSMHRCCMDGVEGVSSSFGLMGQVWGKLVMLGVAFGLPRIFWVLQPNPRCRKAPQGTPSERKEPQAPSNVILPT